MVLIALILLQVLVVAVLIFVFRRVMSQNLTSATSHLDELGQEYAKKEAAVTQQLEEAKQKSAEILAKGQEEAEKLKGQILKTAEEEKEAIIKQARQQADDFIQQADKSRNLLISEMEKRIEADSVKKGAEILSKILPLDLRRQIHIHLISEFIAADMEKMKNLEVPEGVNEAKVTSAFSLEEKDKKAIGDKLKKKAGRDLALHEAIDDNLISGFTLTLGSLVLDCSLKLKIKEKAKELLNKEL